LQNNLLCTVPGADLRLVERLPVNQEWFSASANPKEPPVNQDTATGVYWPTQDWRSSTPAEQGMDFNIIPAVK
jgi:hypothetical protein